MSTAFLTIAGLSFATCIGLLFRSSLATAERMQDVDRRGADGLKSVAR